MSPGLTATFVNFAHFIFTSSPLPPSQTLTQESMGLGHGKSELQSVMCSASPPPRGPKALKVATVHGVASVCQAL